MQTRAESQTQKGSEEKVTSPYGIISDGREGYVKEEEILGNVVSTCNAEHYSWGKGCDGWHLLNRDDLSIIQERVPAGQSEVRHYHRCSRQFFFVLKGEATIEIDGTVRVLRKHEGIEIPPGVPHQFRNESARDVAFLVISMPSSHNDRVVERVWWS